MIGQDGNEQRKIFELTKAIHIGCMMNDKDKTNINWKGVVLNPIKSHYHIINEAGDTAFHDCLDGYLLVDGEELHLVYDDADEEIVKITLKETTPRLVTEFGGGFHGFQHFESSKFACLLKDNGEIDSILAFTDNLKSISRVNPPLGKCVID